MGDINIKNCSSSGSGFTGYSEWGYTIDGGEKMATYEINDKKELEKLIQAWKTGAIHFDEAEKLIVGLISEREEQEKPKKWEPEGGEWYVGIDSVYYVSDSKDELSFPSQPFDFSRGRYYKTKEQAEQALVFQCRAMRFFRWCIEYNPNFCIDDMYELYNLIQDSAMAETLMNGIETGEVEF